MVGKSGSCTSSIIVLIILGLLYEGSQAAETKSSLFCHRCISIQCTTSPEICQLAKEFMQTEITKHYYTDGYVLPDCPPPDELEEWQEFAQQRPSSLPCPQSTSGQATCVLGRFRINSLVVDSNLNLTTYGTAMGCARKELLESIKTTSLGKDRKVINTLNVQKGCYSGHGKSEVRDSLQHFIQLEHCSQISDMCYTQNYCINPLFSIVKSFKRDVNDELMGPPRDSYSFLTILLCVAVVLGIIVAFMTFAGIKYG